MLDRITKWEVGNEAQGEKCIALSEDFFTDHFPRHPVMPGVLIVEAMAQLGGLLLEATCGRDYHQKVKAVLTIIENIKFRNMARPGETLTLHCTITSSREDSGRVKCSAKAGGKRVAEGDLVFAYVHEIDEYLDGKREELLRYWLEGLNE